jgi:hypothetical protein
MHRSEKDKKKCVFCDLLCLHRVGGRQDNPCFDVFVPAPTVLTTLGRQKTRKTQKCETEEAGRQPVHRRAGDRGRGDNCCQEISDCQYLLAPG